MIKWRFLNIPLTPFYYNPPFCPPNSLLINHIFFWKSKVKHTGADVTCFFQDVKSSLTKHKKCFLEASYGISQTSNLQPCAKKVNGLQPKTIPQKNPTKIIERVLKITNFYFWWILPQILTLPINLKIWRRIAAPSLTTHPPHPKIKLSRIQIFKIGFRKLSILSKFWEWCKWQGVRGSSCLCYYEALRTKIDMCLPFSCEKIAQMGQSIHEWTKWNLRKTALICWSASSRLYHFKFFKGCLPQMSLGPFLNTLSQILSKAFDKSAWEKL